MTVTSVVVGQTNPHFSGRCHGGLRKGLCHLPFTSRWIGDSGISVWGRSEFVDADTMASGTFRGAWRREGSRIYMTNVVNLSDGSQNLDMIEFDVGTTQFRASLRTLTL